MNEPCKCNHGTFSLTSVHISTNSLEADGTISCSMFHTKLNFRSEKKKHFWYTADSSDRIYDLC